MEKPNDHHVEEALGDILKPEVLKREQGSMEDFEHLDPDRSPSRDLLDLEDPLMGTVPAQTKSSELDVSPLGISTNGLNGTDSKSFIPEDPFEYNKPLPPEPENIVSSFLRAECGDLNVGKDFKTEEFEKTKEETPETKETPEPEPVPKDPISKVYDIDSFGDVPPPVPKHQSFQEDPRDDFEPSQTPEPEFESPKEEPPVEVPKLPEPKEVIEEEPRHLIAAAKAEVEKIREGKEQASTSLTDICDDFFGAEDIFYKLGLDAWFNPSKLHPKVESLIYWRDVKKSGVVFGVLMVTLLSLIYCSLISVVSYLCLAVLLATTSFRIYKNIMQAVQKTSDGHPFKDMLEADIEVSEARVKEAAEMSVKHLNAWLVELRRLFLVVDLVDSIKFGICLWALTYVGALFNGLTLVILGVIALFTVPKVYENNKSQIDAYIQVATGKISEINNKIKAAIPIGKKEAEKPKDQ